MASFTSRPEVRAENGARRRFVSVGTKLTGAMLVVLCVVTGFAYFEVSRHETEVLLSSKARAALMVSDLFAAGVTAPLSFGDEPGVREHIAQLMANANIVYGGVWAVDPAHPGERGELVGETARGSDVPPAPREIPAKTNLTGTPLVFVVEEPVAGASGELLGVARVAFSLQPQNAAIAAAKDRTLATSLAMGFVLAAVLLALSRTLVVRRLASLARAAKRLEDGSDVDVDVDSNDEVGHLARAFTSMSAAIASREARIVSRNRDLRRVLDNVAEGLMTVKKDGAMSDERSRVLDQWFGVPAESAKIFDYFEAFAPEVGRLLRIGWLALEDDFMPVEVILDQLPRRFRHGPRAFDVDYSPIWKGRDNELVLDEILVVVRDVTSSVERERAEQSQREALRVFRHILLDPAGFRGFMQATAHLLDVIEQNAHDAPRSRRDIHTLNGNAALYGLESLSAACHRIESRLQDEGGAPTAADLVELRAAWDLVCALASDLDGPARRPHVELRTEEYERHLAEIERGAAHAELAATARAWTHELAERRLERIVEQARSIARRVGKADVTIEAHARPTALRLPVARWAPFWSVFTHVLRNTLDHGIETNQERVATGKTGSGRVDITLSTTRTSVELRVEDDGGGIAWEKVRERAVGLGLAHDSHSDLEEALYVDRMTTRHSVTEISGRGVGLGAVREVVVGCGGTIALETSPGRGTVFVFRFPLAMLEDARSSAPSTTPKVA